MSELAYELAYEQAARTWPARLRDLAVYRVATAVDCSVVRRLRHDVQRREGLDVERLRHVDAYAPSALLTAEER
ncbi:hypothetical protein ACVGOW_16195 [Pseudonocardia saturnea]